MSGNQKPANASQNAPRGRERFTPQNIGSRPTRFNPQAAEFHPARVMNPQQPIPIYQNLPQTMPPPPMQLPPAMPNFSMTPFQPVIPSPQTVEPPIRQSQMHDMYEEMMKQFGDIKKTLEQQQQQIDALHKVFSQHIAPKLENQAEQPSTSQTQEKREDDHSEDNKSSSAPIPASSGNEEDTSFESESGSFETVDEQSESPTNSAAESRYEEEETTPEVHTTPTRTPTPIEDDINDKNTPVKALSGDLEQKCSTKDEPLTSPSDDNKTPVQDEGKDEELPASSSEEKNLPSSSVEDGEESNNAGTSSSLEQEQLETVKKLPAKQKLSAKGDKKANKSKQQRETKKKIEKSDEDALAELDNYRSFTVLIPPAIDAYVKCEHAPRHTYLSFQNSNRIVFSDEQQTIVDYWKRGKLVGIHQQKCSEFNVYQRFNEIIQSFRQSEVAEEMKLAFFMQSVLDSEELVIEEDLIYFCDTFTTRDALMAAMELYRDMILSYTGKTPNPVDPPCSIDDFANVEIKFSRDYLANFVTYINEKHIIRYQRNEGVQYLNSFDTISEWAAEKWKDHNTAGLLEYQINLIQDFSETDEKELFLQFLSFMKTIDSCILDYDVFLFREKIIDAAYDPKVPNPYLMFFKSYFGYKQH